MKDWLIEKTVPGLLNDRVLKPYGELTAFKLNSRERSAEGEIMLKGEREPVRVRIGSYEFIHEGDRTFVVINDLITSREWLTRLAQQFVIGKPFELPASMGKYAAMIA
ncbi:MAG TPA: hypothetical protein VK530_00920 [Candidatus Acidoferrum sp.]|nr:hypothetical protein [Candidatus Acidoferrum sp.]